MTTELDISSLSIEAWDLDALTPSVNNHKKHTDETVRRLAKSMNRLGQIQPVLVDKDGEIIAGHGRHLAAKLLGWAKVKVIQLPVDKKTAIEMRIADNTTSNQNIDGQLLAKELREAGVELNELDAFIQDDGLMSLIHADLEDDLGIDDTALANDINASVEDFAAEGERRMEDVENEDTPLRRVFGFTKVSPRQARVLQDFMGVVTKETGLDDPAEALATWVGDYLS